MKLREIIDRLDKSDRNKTHINVEDFSTDTGVSIYDIYSEDLEKHGFAGPILIF